MHHFIAEFKSAIPKEFCLTLINKFEKDNNTTQGRIGSGVDVTKKHSQDLHISMLDHWQDAHQQITEIIKRAVTQYVRAYPHMLIGALAPSIYDEKSQSQRPLKIEDIEKINDNVLSDIIFNVFYIDDINMQKYDQGVGNFQHWHSEHYPHPNDPQQKSLHRSLLWLVYLNDVDEGGETEFIYQQARISPSAGSIVLSPCGFTHTHRGVTPVSGDKYVLASWINYKPASELYLPAL